LSTFGNIDNQRGGLPTGAVALFRGQWPSDKEGLSYREYVELIAAVLKSGLKDGGPEYLRTPGGGHYGDGS